MNLSKDMITKSMQDFVNHRDNLLHEDVALFEHQLGRFVGFCQNDSLVQLVVRPLREENSVDVDGWWEQRVWQSRDLTFPTDTDEELLLRYEIVRSVNKDKDSNLLFQFGGCMGSTKRNDYVELFRSAVIRPLANELSRRMAETTNMATPEARDIQAVPLNRLTNKNETRIFLSHKTIDKPIIYPYYDALKEIGFDPWLDDPDMPAGTNFERKIFSGFQESCAAVFFITENFRDERYLAAEIDYAIQQKRKKGKKFTIITLRYSKSFPVPGLLTPYIYKDVENDLEGFREIIRGLPIELGAIRWKVEVVLD